MFAGSRVFATLTPNGLRCRLPYGRVPHQAKAGGLVRPTTHDDWVVVVSMPVAVPIAVVQLLELSVAHSTARMGEK